MGPHAGACCGQGGGGQRACEPDRPQQLASVRVRHISCSADDGGAYPSVTPPDLPERLDMPATTLSELVFQTHGLNLAA